MSCLINALLPKSKLDNVEARNNPDKHYGFEMGTWTFSTYLYFFDDIAGEKSFTQESYDGLINKIKIFTPKAHEKIIKELKRVLFITPASKLHFGELHNNLLTEKETSALKNWTRIGKQPIYPKKNPLLLNNIKWYERLLQIFETGEATFYSI